MINFEHNEAILFRMLSDLFGRDLVIPSMSVLSICGGSLPPGLDDALGRLGHLGAHRDGVAPGFKTITEWARTNRCLFTVVDHDDSPKIAIDLFCHSLEGALSQAQVVNEVEESHLRLLPTIFKQVGVRYLVFNTQDILDLCSPDGVLDLTVLLQAKLNECTE